jgi:hypothetical protein
MNCLNVLYKHSPITTMPVQFQSVFILCDKAHKSAVGHNTKLQY